MVATGKQLEDDDVISYILTGLDDEYNGLMESMNSRANLISQ
jgi:hypothetical protein